MSSTALANRQLASIVGGTKTAEGRVVGRHRYRLGTAPMPDGGGYVVTLIGEVDGVGMTFEARDFEHAFRRALDVAEDMAEVAGHLREGVVVSVEEFDSIRDIGLDND